MNPLYGVQTPIIIDGNEFIQYLSMSITSNPKNAYINVGFNIARAAVQNLKEYSSLDDIMSDETLLPPNVKKYSEDKLKQHIMTDSRRSPSLLYPEFGIIAYSGNSPLDRPVIKVDGDLPKYYPTPDFTRLVKRL
jgi:hypothetical protein